MNPLLNEMRIVNGVAFNKTTAAIVLMLDALAGDPNEPHGAVYQIVDSHARRLGSFPFNIVSLAYEQNFEDGLAALGEWGEVRFFRDGKIIEETFSPDRGPMRRIAKIENKHIAVGANMQVFERNDNGVWNNISPPETIRTLFEDNHMESLDGYSLSEIYATGTNGVIWYFDGKAWTPVQCPTNFSLYDVYCCEDGFVYICGQGGIILKGRYDSFELITSDQMLTDLWGIVALNGRVFASGFVSLMFLNDEILVPDEDAMNIAEYFYDLDIRDGVMWSFGMKNVLRYEGGKWKPIESVTVS